MFFDIDLKITEDIAHTLAPKYGCPKYRARECKGKPGRKANFGRQGTKKISQAKRPKLW